MLDQIVARTATLAAIAGVACVSALFFPAAPSPAQGLTDRDGYAIVGVKLSERERARSRPVTLPDGRVVLRPYNVGIPWLFGFGDADGAPSGQPTVGGVTPSMDASTPSGGIVPGQRSR